MSDRVRTNEGPDIMRWYLVMSPEYDSGGHYDPPEPGRDFALVEAKDSTSAKWAAWKLWRANPKQCDWPYWSGGGHPLSGVKAQRWETIGEDIDPIPTERDMEAWSPFVVRAS